MKKFVLSLGLLLSCLSMLTAHAAPAPAALANVVAKVTRDSVLQNAIEPYLEAQDTSVELQSLEDILAVAVNPDPVIVSFTVNTIPLWEDATGLMLKGSDVTIDGSNNLSGVNNISAGGTITAATGVTVSTLGEGVVHSSVSGVLSSSPVVNTDIVDNTISGDKITDVTITNGKLADGTIANAKLAAVDSANTPNALVVRDGSGDFAANVITAEGGFVGYVTGTVDSAHSFLDALVGDVTGNQDATVVSSVGGKTAAAVADATIMVETATWDDPIYGTLVRRDPADGTFFADRIYITESISGDTVAATKAYVDAVISTGLSLIESVTAYANSNITPSGLPKTIDGVTLTVAGKRVLLNGQTDRRQNGVWLTNGSNWTRPADYATGTNAVGAYTFVTAGNTYAETSWAATAEVEGCTLIDTCSIIFTQFSIPDQTIGANVGSGSGIYRDKTGLTLNFKTLTDSNGLEVESKNSHYVSIGADRVGAMTVSRLRATGNFYGNLTGNVTGNVNGTVTGTVTGASSLNLLKTGGTPDGVMTGLLTVPANGLSSASLLFGTSIGLASGSLLSTGTIAVMRNGVNRMIINSGGIAAQLPMQGLDGTVTIPEYSFTSDQDTGMYRSNTNEIGFTVGNSLRQTIGNGMTTSNNRLAVASGTEAIPGISYSTDTNTGLYNPAPDAIGFSVGGNEVMRTTTANVVIKRALLEGPILSVPALGDVGGNYSTVDLTAAHLNMYPIISIDMTFGGQYDNDLYVRIPVANMPAGQTNILLVRRTGSGGMVQDRGIFLEQLGTRFHSVARMWNNSDFSAFKIMWDGANWSIG